MSVKLTNLLDDKSITKHCQKIIRVTKKCKKALGTSSHLKTAVAKVFSKDYKTSI